MNRKFLAVALVAPLVAVGPATADAHQCSKYRHHHARGADKGAYGGGKSMRDRDSQTNRNQGAGAQDLDQGTVGGQGGATDQGSTGSSKRQGI